MGEVYNSISELKDHLDIHLNKMKYHMETRLGEYETQFAWYLNQAMEIIYRTRCFWNLHGIKVYFRSIIPVTHAPSPAVLDVSGCIGKNSHRVEIKTKIKYINERLLSLYELAFGIELSSNLHAAFRDLFALYLWVNSTHHHYGPSLVAIKPCLFGATTWLELPFV